MELQPTHMKWRGCLDNPKVSKKWATATSMKMNAQGLLRQLLCARMWTVMAAMDEYICRQLRQL